MLRVRTVSDRPPNRSAGDRGQNMRGGVLKRNTIKGARQRKSERRGKAGSVLPYSRFSLPQLYSQPNKTRHPGPRGASWFLGSFASGVEAACLFPCGNPSCRVFLLTGLTTENGWPGLRRCCRFAGAFRRGCYAVCGRYGDSDRGGDGSIVVDQGRILDNETLDFVLGGGNELVVEDRDIQLEAF
jgi:hypothetical protein